MTLRRRLLLGLAASFCVFAVGVVFTIVAQRDHLIDQVDDRLASTPLPPAGRRQAPGAPAEEPAQDPADAPISELYLATIKEDGDLSIVIEGQLLNDTPAIEPLVEEPPSRRTFSDVDGVNGASTFRVLFLPAVNNTPTTIVAVPLDDVEATMDQLIFTFVAVAFLIAAVLALIAFWVDRLGVRPITEMTAAADAIAGGERDRRAVSYGATTEAGRLATALNLMLDDRDDADDRLRRFVSNASHELRTPLTSIRGYLDLYVEGGFREPGQLDDAVRRMQAESARMNLLVDDLLLLAKLDEQQPLEATTVDVGLLLSDITASVRAAHPRRTIEVDSPDDLSVRADPIRLQQAVAGLVDNAVTHTPADALIRLEGTRLDQRVEITVSDTGPGLTEGEASRVFDRFYRGDDSRSRSSGGSGLGLSIARSIIQAHGGDITVDSEPGHGAAFTVHLPASP